MKLNNRPRLKIEAVLYDPVNLEDPFNAKFWVCSHCKKEYKCPCLIWTLFLTLFAPKDCTSKPMMGHSICTTCAAEAMNKAAESHLKIYTELFKK